MRLYHYERCGTCKKARAWLGEAAVSIELVDIVTAPPGTTELRRALASVGSVRKLFNTSGQSYRQGGFKERLGTMSEDEALAALAADGKLIKRPMLFGPDFVLVGFQPGQWAAYFGGRLGAAG